MRYTVKLRNLNLLTVGSAYPRLTTADITTVRIGGVPVIPGSSFKGSLRTSAHRAASKVNRTSCGEIEPRKIVEAHKRMGRRCDVCSLFGMPGPGATSDSKVIVSALYPSSGVETATLTRVSISPVKGKAERGGLFSLEVVPLCTTFEGEIILLDDSYKDLLLASLDEMRNNTIGKGSLLDLKVEGDLPDEFKHLSEWRWDICP